MGCQCTNKEEEKNNEVLKKEKNLEDEQYQEDNNNNSQKEGLFGLTNQDLDPAHMGETNNGNEYGGSQEENYNYSEKINEDRNARYSEYPEKMLDLINKIRNDPVSYADIIEDSIPNIIEDQDKDDETKTRIIYKKKVKVALNRGEPAFHEAAEELRNMNSLPPLELKSEICVPLPEDEE